MKKIDKKLNAALVLGLACSVGAHAAPTVDLSGAAWVTYGDANSYALGDASGINVSSAAGQIDSYVKIALHSNGHMTNGIVGMDDAYSTPTANTDPSFRMSNATYSGSALGATGWDRANWWNSTLSALDSKLDLTHNSMVFFFANNETGSEPDLSAWGRVELTQISTGTSLGIFDMTNDPTHAGSVGYGPPPVGGGVVGGNPAAYTSNGAVPVVSDFVDSGNQICLLGGVLVSCSSPHDTSYSQNLGANNAAYAVVVPELDAAILSLIAQGMDLSDYALHVDARLGCGPEMNAAGTGSFPTDSRGDCAGNYALNGGEEKLFIGTELAQTAVPEPASGALAALGLAGVAVLRRRSGRKAA